MACRGCVTVRAVPAAIDLRVSLAAPTPVACVTSTPHAATLYSNAMDMRAINCVRGDPTRYLSNPLGEIVLGESILG